MKSDTGQHSQFLRCFEPFPMLGWVGWESLLWAALCSANKGDVDRSKRASWRANLDPLWRRLVRRYGSHENPFTMVSESVLIKAIISPNQFVNKKWIIVAGVSRWSTHCWTSSTSSWPHSPTLTKVEDQSSFGAKRNRDQQYGSS